MVPLCSGVEETYRISWKEGPRSSCSLNSKSSSAPPSNSYSLHTNSSSPNNPSSFPPTLGNLQRLFPLQTLFPNSLNQRTQTRWLPLSVSTWARPTRVSVSSVRIGKLFHQFPAPVAVCVPNAWESVGYRSSRSRFGYAMTIDQPTGSRVLAPIPVSGTTHSLQQHSNSFSTVAKSLPTTRVTGQHLRSLPSPTPSV